MKYPNSRRILFCIGSLTLISCLHVFAQGRLLESDNVTRQRISLNEDWRFYKYGSTEKPDELIYDMRPEVRERRDDLPADTRPTEAEQVEAKRKVLKPWILPTGNDFINDPAKRHTRPNGNPGHDFPFVQIGFNDSSWELVDLPHDWAIKGPFYGGPDPEVGGGMGRLPSPGVAWYRKMFHLPTSDAGKSIFLEIDGAMSYAMVWLNGTLVGGWPYGYNSWRVDLTPYVVPGGDNQLAIRLDNPPHSSRWYPGGGLYRNVWITKVNPVHVDQWGAVVTPHEVTSTSARVDLAVDVVNLSASDAAVTAETQLFLLDAEGNKTGWPAATVRVPKAAIAVRGKVRLHGSVLLRNPRLWGPPPTQSPDRYVAVTTLFLEGTPVDVNETRFGIRSLRFDPDSGSFVNGEHIPIKGANLHHDLGPLGAAFHTRAAERQLEILREMGCNAIRTAHNPPSPELLELTDRMGFLVVDEIFDIWEQKKTPLDFHLIFPDWHEQDLRAFIRRDRNHPSVILWSFGNEVGEQYTGDDGAAMGKRLHEIVKEEDPTRPTTSAINFAKPHMPLPGVMDVISLNYQGEGIRDAPEYSHLQGIKTSPLYPAFKERFPGKVIVSAENAAAVSSRGEYLFPVTQGISAPVSDSAGGNPETQHVSAYELYTAPFGSSADKVLASLEKHPYVAGGFVWSGWDYLGEPTPYYSARSSYFGIIDLAGFKKDRFYLYQSHWRPELPMVHILPHWNWPERTREVTPVHVFTSGDEAELFLNGRSLGRKKKNRFEYRLRWDDVRYEPGELKVVAYKSGRKWAEDTVKTTGDPAQLDASADRDAIRADGQDLAFISVRVTDGNGLTVPRANNVITFKINGPGEIVATDNGDPTDFEPFASHTRKAFHGLALAIVRAKRGQSGPIMVTVTSPEVRETRVVVRSR